MRIFVRKIALAAVFGTAVGTASCGPRGVEPLKETGASLEGTVYYGAEKVPVALVIVAKAGAGGGSSSAFADDDGNYKIDNVPVGDVLLAVNTDATKGQLMSRAMAGTNPTEKGKKLTVPKHTDVPKKYHAPDTSGLSTRTEAGVNKHDIKISK